MDFGTAYHTSKVREEYKDAYNNSHIDAFTQSQFNNSYIDYEKFESLKYKPTDNIKFRDYNTLEKSRKIGKIITYAASMGVGFALLNVLGVAVAGVIVTKVFSKKDKKFKLIKDSYVKNITLVETVEKALIASSNRKLERQIEEILEKNNNRYTLDVYKKKYENQIELLNRIIDIRRFTKANNGDFTDKYLRMFALRQELHNSKYNLSNINKKIKRKELIRDIGREKINLEAPIYRSLTLGNIYLNTLKAKRKIKLYSNKATIMAKDFIKKRINKVDDDQVIRYHPRHR